MKSNIFQLSHRIKSIIEASCTNNRGRYRTAATSKMELFVIIVNGSQLLTIITKSSTLNVAAVLDPSKFTVRGIALRGCLPEANIRNLI